MVAPSNAAYWHYISSRRPSRNVVQLSFAARCNLVYCLFVDRHLDRPGLCLSLLEFLPHQHGNAINLITKCVSFGRDLNDEQ